MRAQSVLRPVWLLLALAGIPQAGAPNVPTSLAALSAFVLPGSYVYIGYQATSQAKHGIDRAAGFARKATDAKPSARTSVIT